MRLEAAGWRDNCKILNNSQRSFSQEAKDIESPIHEWVCCLIWVVMLLLVKFVLTTHYLLTNKYRLANIVANSLVWRPFNICFLIQLHFGLLVTQQPQQFGRPSGFRSEY